MRVVNGRNWRWTWIDMLLAVLSLCVLNDSVALSTEYALEAPGSSSTAVRLPWQPAGQPDRASEAVEPSTLPTVGLPTFLTSTVAGSPAPSSHPAGAGSLPGGASFLITQPERAPAAVPTPLHVADARSAAAPGVGSPIASPAPQPMADQASGALLPVPDQQMDPNAAPAIFPASLKGVTPGQTAMEDVIKEFGQPRQVVELEGLPAHLYSVAGFDHVEVLFDRAGTVRSIVVQFPRAIDARQFRGAMSELQNIEPVMISNELGFVLGQAFPERGVLCSFAPADRPHAATMMVTQVIFEAVSPESFLLRAEVRLDTSWQKAQRDLNVVTKLDPLNARAHWLLSRISLLQGNYQQALNECTRAVQIVPNDPEYMVTRADILRQLNRTEEAIQQAEAALAASQQRAHIRARTLSLLGDLHSTGPASDHVKAYEMHSKAIQLAESLASSPHPAIRIAAKEVLIDAHLGAAHDIAWGDWEQKEVAVPRWLEKAQAFANELIETEGRGEEPRFRVATRALACYVGMKGQLDPAPWLLEVDRLGRKLVTQATDPHQKCQLQWNIGLVLFDAVQIYQMRKEYEKAMAHGEKAVDYLEQGIQHRNGFADAYVLARLYFRLGVIHAVGLEDHAVAVTWFDKAIPIFNQSADHISPHELGRFGETFVSMGVSYWQAGRQQQAVELTQRGARLIDLAVEQELLPMNKLETPYSNLAIMLRKLGRPDEADQYFDMALRTKNSIRR